MHKNIPVLEFSPYTETMKFLNRNEAPFSIRSAPEEYETIRAFCASRILRQDRKFRDVIIQSCNVINSSPVSLALTSGALTFRDSYWLRDRIGAERWADVNLYANLLSKELAETALTGEESSIRLFDENAGSISGELTGLGTKAKCFFKEGGHICMAKALSSDQITAEILSHTVAAEMGLSSAVYTREIIFDTDCSVCHIRTNENVELITARDILMHYDCPMKIDTDYYRLFMKVDPLNFLRMQLFDYITLNIDRNRDNFALYMENGKVRGLYDIFDHDACFRGLSPSATYFVTGTTFIEMLRVFKETYADLLEQVMPDVLRLKQYLENEGLSLFQRHGKATWLTGMLDRINLFLT